MSPSINMALLNLGIRAVPGGGGPPDNEEQVIATNTGMTVDEGSTDNVISAAMLETTDVDNTAAELVYTITTEPVNGQLYLDGTPIGDTDTFTQDDVDNSLVTYDHDGSETTSDSFEFGVDDGEGTASSDTFAITVTPAVETYRLIDDSGNILIDDLGNTLIHDGAP